MAAPNITIQTIDLSTRIPGFPGVYGAIVIPAKKGPIDEAQLVTSEADLMAKFTPNEGIESGYSLAYYSAIAFLQKSNKLWVKRAIGTSYAYGGLVLKTLTSDEANAALVSGESDPTAYTFGTYDECLIYAKDPGAWNDNIGIKVQIYRATESVDLDDSSSVIDGTNNTIEVSQKYVTGEAVRLSISTDSGDCLPEPLDGSITYYVIAVDADTIKLATSLVNAQAGTAVDLTPDTGDGYGQGTMTITPINEVKESGAFTIEVYKSSDTANPVETWTVSRVVGSKDGNNQNMYIEDVLEGSDYIRCEDNTLIANTVLPKPQPTILYLDGGDDGNAVTDGAMLTAAAEFINTNDKPITVLMDGGWATVAYQTYLNTIASTRQDCVCCLSIPYSYEASSNYLNRIIDYKKLILNMSSASSALYTPYVKIYDKYLDRDLYVPPDGYGAAAISYSYYNYELWYPPAGFKRGMLDVTDLRRRFTVGEMDYLYDNNVNPLRFYPGKGIMIWGQKTTYAQPSALDRLNVKLLLIFIQPAIALALETFIMELNNTANRAIAKSMVDTYMDNIKARGGVYDYYTQCDSDNNTQSDIDNHKMNLHLFIKPTISAEYIKFVTVITSTSMSFSLAQTAVGTA